MKPFVQFSPKQETIGVLSSKEKKNAAAGKAARGADLATGFVANGAACGPEVGSRCGDGTIKEGGS